MWIDIKKNSPTGANVLSVKTDVAGEKAETVVEKDESESWASDDSESGASDESAPDKSAPGARARGSSGSRVVFHNLSSLGASDTSALGTRGKRDSRVSFCSISTREMSFRRFQTSTGYSQTGLRDREKLWSQSTWTLWQIAKYSKYTVYALILAHVLGIGGWAFPDGSQPTCAPVDGRSRNASMCGLAAALEGGSKDILLLVSFVLGGFLLSTRGLWMTRRTAYCALCGATRNLLINLSTLAPPEERRVLSRWAVPGYELSVLKGRSLVDTDDAGDFLRKSNLIAGDEWERMVDGDRHTTVWYWIQAKAESLRIKGEIDPLAFQTICNAVTLSRDKANDLMSCIDRDQPPPYVFVCGILVNVSLYFRAITSGVTWAVWMNDAPGLKIWTEPRFYAGIVILQLFTAIFSMLFDVCEVRGR